MTEKFDSSFTSKSDTIAWLKVGLKKNKEIILDLWDTIGQEKY